MTELALIEWFPAEMFQSALPDYVAKIGQNGDKPMVIGKLALAKDTYHLYDPVKNISLLSHYRDKALIETTIINMDLCSNLWHLSP